MSHPIWMKLLINGHADRSEQRLAADHINRLERLLAKAHCPNHPHCDGDGYPVMSGMLDQIETNKEKCKFCHKRRELLP